MSFDVNWQFMLNHMPAVREILKELPAKYFLDFATATPQQDMEQATDLILEIPGGTMAVRMRRNKWYHNGLKRGFDWSIRYECRGQRTEIDKLRDGFADWYFYGYSADDISSIIAWWLIDLNLVRDEQILEETTVRRMLWDVHRNGSGYGLNFVPDGTSALYVPMGYLEQQNCILDSYAPINQKRLI